MSSQADTPIRQCAFEDDASLRMLVFDACARIQIELNRYAPVLGREVCAWMDHLSPTHSAPDYFLQSQSFPLVRLIWWAAKEFSTDVDREFIVDVIYSTINGYYYIRLLDNLMDSHYTVELKILPAAAFFHTEFQSTYQKYFEAAHPFWNKFRSAWFSTSEAVAHELTLAEIRRPDFETITVNKLSAATIPITGIAYHYHAIDRLHFWDKFTSALARWSQLEDDLFDWQHDLMDDKTSYFLTEAAHQTDIPSVEAWVLRRGFREGLERLQRELSALRPLAAQLHNPDIDRYLDSREAMLVNQNSTLVKGLQTLFDLIQVVKSKPATPHAVQT